MHQPDPDPALPMHRVETGRSSLAGFALRSLCARVLGRRALWLAVPLVALVSLFVNSAPTPAVIPRINLAADPLYAAASGDKATLALALSVEFPTVGAQYTAANSATDNTYANTVEYLGYYDAEACYTYNNAPTETVPAGMSVSDLKRFDRIGAATARRCSNAFSGNFLNWASNSAVDMLRLALSGGDRSVDTPDLTILQRAVIPNGDPICMWNSSNFPAKQLARDGGGANQYWGAVPTAMINAANGSDIWVANTLNRIYFSSARGGSCNDTTGYNLAGALSRIGTVETRSQSLPGNSVQCAVENGNCSFTGEREVWYGANNSWRVAPASNGVACTNAVFGDPISGTAKACYTRQTNWTPPTSANSLNSDGFFYARVQVCNVNASGVLQDVRNYGTDLVLCRQYPNGKFKPGGAIQKYSDQLRLAAFGYVLDQTASYNAGGRYGGVLRAPMKYVGARTFDENGIDNTATGGNPAREWDLNSGVFYANPDGDTTQTPRISGVINYLNKFGRTGTTPGRYKRYDPVGELHYEALRYLQGTPPSPDAVVGLTADMSDGFPLYTDWSSHDPYGGSRNATSDYSCLKSNIVVIGDINTHDGNRLPTPSAANNIPDINYWRGIVQAYERNSATDYADGQGVTRTTGNPNGANGSVPGGSQTSQIMGSAYWANTHDIRGTAWTVEAKRRPGLRVKTFVFDVNENGTQSNAGTRRNANQFFMAAKYGGFETKQPLSGGDVFNTAGNPFRQDDGTANNNVWQKLADPGEAGTYYLQSSARGVLNAFEDIFSRSSSGARSIGGSSATSRELSAQSGSLVFQGSFNTEDWSGDVLATSVSLANGSVAIGDRPVWSASDMLLARANRASSRNIVVGNDTANPQPTALPFVWGNLSSTMQAALNKPDPTTASDNRGERRVNYLRGDQADETPVATAVFRPRTKLLGDVVNSGVVYSGRLSNSASNAPGYAAFASASAGRTAAVYVGANDGMLHAFNASDGSELFAYIPSWVVPNLSALTSKTYVANHRSYVDAPPVVGAANLSTGTSTDWRTVLVSGTGGGGKGVFALDVTNPASFGASNVMWEFTEAHDIDMGHVVGRPQILRMRTSASGVSPVTYKWFAAVASGVNNYVGASGGNYSEGRPALFLLDLSKSVGTPWTLGTNYFKVSIPTDATLAATTPTGLLNFKAELGTSGEVLRIYMGDLHGKLWRLDFNRAGGTADWTMGGLSAFRTSYGGACTTPCVALPLFTAKDGTGKVQPITMAPTIAFSGSSQVNYVAFGTGKYLEVADKTGSGQQSFYALYDDIESANQPTDTTGGASLIKDRSRLRAGTADRSTTRVTVNSFRWGRRTSDDASAAGGNVYSGWYVDFPDPGERQVSNIVVNGDLLEFNTLYPSSTTANVCGSNDGSGNSYALNIDTGEGVFRRSTVGVLGEAIVLQVNVVEMNRNDPNATSASDSTGRRIRRVTTTTLGPGSKGLATVSTTTQDIIIGRLSWRRINNYHELKP